MVRYTAEQKNEALSRAKEIGVPKTSTEMGISIQTLYKWQREAKEAGAVDPATFDAKKMLADVEVYKEQIAMLENESAALREQNEQLLAQNEKLRNVVTMLIG